MEDNHTIGEVADTEEDVSELASDAGRIARREALKKAAAGGVVAGAMWMAPRVEGLSLVPDYASAGTATGLTKVFTIDTGGSDGPASINSDNGGALTGCDNGLPPIYGNDWAAVSPASNPGITVVSPQPNARNAAINMSYALPSAAGTVNALIPSGWDADLNVNRTVTMGFTIDPPWNKCRVQSAAMNRCDGSTGTVNVAGTNPAPGATNPAPFTVDVVVPGPQPSNMRQLRITVECV